MFSERIRKMKPYFRVMYNTAKMQWLRKFKCSSFATDGIQLFGWNTKISVQRSSNVHFGRKVNSDGRLTIFVGENAKLTIGDSVYFNEGCMLSSHESITIGDHCLFGPNVMVIDNDHEYSRDGVSTNVVSAPITIGNNCWIGANAVILRGTTIGDNCVIGAGCIVKGNIPDSSKVTQDRKLNIEELK